MGIVDRRLLGHWEHVRTERDEERRFLTQMLRERTIDTNSLTDISNELERFRASLDADRPPPGPAARTPNLGDFD
jgi:hypothetical protein